MEGTMLATVTSVSPNLRVRLSGTTGSVPVAETAVKTDQLQNGSRVTVNVVERRIVLTSLIGGLDLSDPEGSHLPVPAQTISGLGVTQGIRTLTMAWTPIPAFIGTHGYYEAQISTSPLFDSDLRRQEVFQPLAVFVNLIPSTAFYARVRAVGSDGVVSAWTTLSSPLTVDGVLGSDLADGAVARDKIEQFAIDHLLLDKNAVRYQHLLIGNFDNLIIDPSFDLGFAAGHTVRTSGGGSWGHPTEIGRGGGPCFSYSTTNQTSNARLELNGPRISADPHIKASQGDEFYIEVYVSATSAVSKPMRVGLSFFNAQGNVVGVEAFGELTNPSTAWQKVSASTFTAGCPSGTAYVVPFLEVRSTGSTGQTVRFDDAYMRRRVDGNLVVDGTITTRHIESGSITAAKIAAGSITASKIAAGSVVADKIAAGSITAAKISALGITANVLNGGTINGDNINVVNLNANNIVSGSISADKISAGTLSAINFQTSPGATAVRIGPSYGSGSVFFFTSGVQRGRISGEAGGLVLDGNDFGLFLRSDGVIRCRRLPPNHEQWQEIWASKFQVISDRSFKSDVEDYKEESKLHSLRPSSYTMDGKSELGFIANDLPEEVRIQIPKDYGDKDPEPTFGYSLSAMTALLAAELNMLAERIEKIESAGNPISIP